MKIAIGGMIASGKSTLVENLGRELKLPILEEFEKDDKVFNTLLEWLYTGVADVEILLQIYFIHNHYLRQKEYGHDFIVDRDLIEHWIFAKTNLEKHPEVMNMYNGIFMAYMNQITKPDLYIILDITFEEFLNRLKERGRESETDNLEDNLEYFRDLHSDYTERLAAQCVIYGIPYTILETSDLTEDQVLDKALGIIKERF